MSTNSFHWMAEQMFRPDADMSDSAGLRRRIEALPANEAEGVVRDVQRALANGRYTEGPEAIISRAEDRVRERAGRDLAEEADARLRERIANRDIRFYRDHSLLRDLVREPVRDQTLNSEPDPPKRKKQPEYVTLTSDESKALHLLCQEWNKAVPLHAFGSLEENSQLAQQNRSKFGKLRTLGLAQTVKNAEHDRPRVYWVPTDEAEAYVSPDLAPEKFNLHEYFGRFTLNAPVEVPIDRSGPRLYEPGVINADGQITFNTSNFNLGSFVTG